MVSKFGSETPILDVLYFLISNFSREYIFGNFNFEDAHY